MEIVLFTDAVILARAQTNFELVETGPEQQVGEIARDWAPLYGTMAAWLCSAGSRASCSGAIEICACRPADQSQQSTDRAIAKMRSVPMKAREVGGEKRLEGGIAHVESRQRRLRGRHNAA